MQSLKSFWNKPPSNLATFQQERPQKPGHETVSTLHQPKNDILPFFKFLQKEVSQLVKKTPAHFYPTLGVLICKDHVVRPLHSFNKYRKFLFSSLVTFFCRNLKNERMSFLSPCNAEIVPVPGFQGLSCSKTVGWRVICSKKLSMATFFIFWVSYLVDSFLTYLPVKRI